MRSHPNMSGPRHWPRGTLGLTLAALLGAWPSSAQGDCRYGIDPNGECAKEPRALPVPQSVEIESNPPNADLFEVVPSPEGPKEISRGKTPAKLHGLAAGTHKFIFRLENYEERIVELPIQATGVQKPRPKDSKDEPPIKLREKPKLTIELKPDEKELEGQAEFYIDGKRIETGRPKDLHVERGPHTIRVQVEGHFPWETTSDLQGDQKLTASLPKNVGYLFVGADPKSNLVGVTVYITPRSSNSDEPSPELPGEDIIQCKGRGPESETVLTTPIQNCELAPGEYTVVLFTKSKTLWSPFIQKLPVTIKLGKPSGVPATFPLTPSPDYYTARQAAGWKSLCLGEKKSGIECGAAGYALLHQETPDVEGAKNLYKAGCDVDDRESCLGYGYLLKREMLRECSQVPEGCDKKTVLAAGSEFLEKACSMGSEAACWYRHVNKPDVDPTVFNPMAYEYEYEAEKIGGFVFSPLVGVWPAGSFPVYAEAAARFYVEPTRWLGISVGGALRLRTLVQEDYAKSPHELSRAWRVGYGLDLGFYFRPGTDRFFLHASGRYTGYFNDLISAWGVSGGLGFGSRDHVIEIGTIVETMPTRVLSVDVFGTERVLADRVWSFLPYVEYSYRLWLF